MLNGQKQKRMELGEEREKETRAQPDWLNEPAPDFSFHGLHIFLTP